MSKMQYLFLFVSLGAMTINRFNNDVAGVLSSGFVLIGLILLWIYLSIKGIE